MIYILQIYFAIGVIVALSVIIVFSDHVGEKSFDPETQNKIAWLVFFSFIAWPIVLGVASGLSDQDRD